MSWHRCTLTLTSEQRAELENVRDHDAKAHMRQKATALLLVADGHAPYAVARRLLGKRIDEDSVYAWLNLYKANGVNHLRVKGGRGRKPAFSPSGADSRLRSAA